MITFNPQLTTAPQNSFLLTTEGYVQGAFMDDPSSRMYLTSGQIAASVSQPIWGGMAITENIPATNTLGSSLVLAANNAGVTGFTVFNQANNGIITPGNNVQQYGAGMTTSFFRLGSNARVAVQCSSALANALDTGSIAQQVSWDFTNQQLIPYSSSIGALPVKVLSVSSNSKIVSYSSSTGAVTWGVGAAAIIQL